jgi:hypothetical protein
MNSKVPKSTILAIAGILLIPLLVGYGMVYSLLSNADVKYAKEVEVKILATQFNYMTGSLIDLKSDIGNLSRKIDALHKSNNKTLESNKP